MPPTALVTGANRGIGLEVCRQLLALGHTVILTSRDEKAGQQAARSLNGPVHVVQMNVAVRDSVQRAADRIQSLGLQVDVLINNAGLLVSGGSLEVKDEVWLKSTAIQFLGPVWTCRTFVPGMVERNWGRVVNVSSGYGLYSEALQTSPPAYGVTKAALNAFTYHLAAEVPETIKVNAVCPGWVRTRMGGPDANRSVEEGAAGVVRAATLPDDGPTGAVFRDDRMLEW